MTAPRGGARPCSGRPSAAAAGDGDRPQSAEYRRQPPEGARGLAPERPSAAAARFRPSLGGLRAGVSALALAGVCSGLPLAQADGVTPSAAAASVAATGDSLPVGRAVTYRFDPDQTFVTFEVRHFWTSTLRGRFGPISGEVTVDRAAGAGDLRLRIPMGSLDTGVRTLDARLKEADLFAVADYPEAYFIATTFHFDAAGGVQEVRGEFILRGVSEPLSLYARHFACRQAAAGGGQPARQVCGGDFTGDLKRSRFGATFGLPFVGDDVHLVVQVEAVSP